MRDFFDVPLKDGVSLPCLRYDIALYCREMDHVFPKEPPEYLCEYAARLKHHAIRGRDYRPDAFPEATRTYIFDNRMHALFAMLDETRDATRMMYDYAQGGFEIEDYIFGYGVEGIEESAHLERFVRQYQFVPNDFLAFNHLAFFFEDRFIAAAHLSTAQTVVLLERYREQNLVDLKRLAEREF